MLRASTFCKPYTACMANTYSSSVEVKINSKPHDLHNACESMTCCILNGINGADGVDCIPMPCTNSKSLTSNYNSLAYPWPLSIGTKCSTVCYAVRNHTYNDSVGSYKSHWQHLAHLSNVRAAYVFTLLWEVFTWVRTICSLVGIKWS